MLKAGTKAPDITLPDQNGKMHSLSDYRGKKVILYFYPKDSTPGCTKQACGFGERYPQFLEKGAVVLGVSRDSVASHKKFEEKSVAKWNRGDDDFRARPHPAKLPTCEKELKKSLDLGMVVHTNQSQHSGD